MINNYNEFLLEHAISMINESEIFYSKKFKKLLNDIDSPISKHLKEIETKDLKVTSNFFDIADNKDVISFIADRKAQEIIGENKDKSVVYSEGHPLSHNLSQNGGIFAALGYKAVGDSPYCPDDEEKGTVISKTVSPTSGRVFLYVKFEGGECVLNQDYIIYTEIKDMWSKNRQTVRTGRGIRALLNASGQKFTDVEIEDFVNKYKSAFDRMNDVYSSFDLVSGDDISFWYDYKNYSQGTNRGSLGNSCMANGDSEWFEIYTLNPDVCSLLILKDDDADKIKGRALVWKLTTPEITFMDRIYTHEDSDIQLFKDYAIHKGWHYKKYNNSSPEGELVNSNGNVNFDLLSVDIKKIGYDKFPYVDTLKYYDVAGSRLTNDENRSYKCLEDTDGGYTGECDECGGRGTVECEECNGRGNHSCNDCDGDGNIECGHCDGEGTKDGEKCKECDGEGNSECSTCDGDGRQDCNDCDGYGRVSCPECG